MSSPDVRSPAADATASIAEPPLLIDIARPKPFTSLAYFMAIVLVSIVTGLPALAYARSVGYSHDAAIAIATIIGVVAVALTVLLWPRGRGRMRAALARQDDELPQRLRDALDVGPADGAAAARLLATHLAEQGRAGQSFRFHNKPVSAVRPMNESFEPEPVSDMRSIKAWVTGVAETEDRGVLGNFWRNTRLMGTRVAMAVFGIQIATGLYDWVSRGQASMRLIVFSVLLLILFLPTAQSVGWLVGPGVLIRRRGEWRDRQRQEIFTRSKSVLVVGPYTNTHGWVFAVSDGRVAFSGMIHPAEADLLLSAWLSPVPPPPEELIRNMGVR